MKNQKRLYQFIDHRSLFLYLLVGGLSAGIYFGLFSFFYAVLNMHYKWALTLGFFLSTVFNFLSNRHVTFQSHTHAAHVQLIKYICLLIVNYALNLMIAHFSVSVLGLSPYLGVIIAIGCAVPFTYLMSKYWVFRLSK